MTSSGWKLLTVSHHLAIFGSDWWRYKLFTMSRDHKKPWLRDQATLWVGALHGTSAPRHVIEVSGDHNNKSPTARFAGHWHNSSGDIMVLICHVTLQDHMNKLLNDFLVRTPARYVTILPSLLAIGTVTKIL